MVKTSPSNAGSLDSISGWEAKIPHASGQKTKNIKPKQYRNKLNKDFYKWSTLKKNIFNYNRIIKKKKKEQIPRLNEA